MTDAPRRRHSGCAVRFFVFLAVLIGGGIYFYWENNTIAVHEETVYSTHLPSSFDGLRVAQISDLHGKEFGTDHTLLLRTMQRAMPDIIVITGDLIDSAEQYETLPALMDGLTDIAPTYYITGNHEWAVRHVQELKTLLREHGVRVLTNEYDLWTRGGQTLAVAGIDDPNGPADQKTGPELRSEIDADFVMLLSHRDTVEMYSGWDYDLVFCGHGHGGVIRIPVLDRGIFCSDHTLFPKYDGGMYTFGDFTCCVSRGMGSNTVPVQLFRLFNRPDLPVVILRCSQ